MGLRLLPLGPLLLLVVYCLLLLLLVVVVVVVVVVVTVAVAVAVAVVLAVSFAGPHVQRGGDEPAVRRLRRDSVRGLQERLARQHVT